MMPWAQWLHPDVLPQLPVGYLSSACSGEGPAAWAATHWAANPRRAVLTQPNITNSPGQVAWCCVSSPCAVSCIKRHLLFAGEVCLFFFPLKHKPFP